MAPIICTVHFAGRPNLLCLSVSVHKRSSFWSSFLHLHECQGCLVHYECFVRWEVSVHTTVVLQITVSMILTSSLIVYLQFSFCSRHFVKSKWYNNTVVLIQQNLSKNSSFILTEISDFHVFVNIAIAFNANLCIGRYCFEQMR